VSPLPRHRGLVDHIFVLRDRGALTGPGRSVFATPFREVALVAACPDDGTADLSWQLVQVPPRFKRQARAGSLHGWMMGLRADPLAAGLDEVSRALWDRSGDLAEILAKEAGLDAVVAWFDGVLDAAAAARSDEDPAPQSPQGEALRAWRRVLSARGVASATIARLARATNITPRTLQRHVRARTGLSPKRYAALRRFNAALHEVAGGSGGFADVAMTAGYCDQAHMTADLTQHTGAPPGRLRMFARRQSAPDAARYFADAAVRARVTLLLTAPDPT